MPSNRNSPNLFFLKFQFIKNPLHFYKKLSGKIRHKFLKNSKTMTTL